MRHRDETHPQLFVSKIKRLSFQHAKIIALCIWLVTIGAYWWITDQYNLSPEEKIKMLEGVFTDSFYGPILFIIFFSLQPLIFFPSFLVGIAGGILYGPVAGTLYVIIGANGAANVCYGVGRFFGAEFVGENQRAAGLMERYMHRLRSNTFETILVMHLLIVVPFDIVNYIAGFLKMRWRSFAVATAIGATPGIFTFVLFGHSLGSIDNIVAGHPEINFFTLFLSGVMLIFGLSLSQLIKQREKHFEQPEIEERQG